MLQSDKGRRSRKARRALAKGHFHFGLQSIQFLALKGLKGLSKSSKIETKLLCTMVQTILITNKSVKVGQIFADGLFPDFRGDLFSRMRPKLIPAKIYPLKVTNIIMSTYL